MKNNPKPNDIYKHFKGSLYKVITVALHSETGEQMVVYQALYGNYQVYVRPFIMFTEKVDIIKYPDAGQEYRFELMTQLIDVTMPDGTRPSSAVSGQGMEPVQQKQESAGIQQKPTQPEEEAAGEELEELAVDKSVMEFLEADTYEDKLGILTMLHARITDDMINTMAIAIDVEVEQGDIETRYQGLKSCLLMLEKFECSRIR